MSGFYLLNAEQVKEKLNLADIITEIEKAYALKSKGNGAVFPVITHDWITGEADMDIKSGYIEGDVNIYGLKALTYIEANKERRLPCLMGTMMIFNSETGEMKGILDATNLTGYRTGAAGAIGSKYLARPNSKKLLLIGAGKQALFNLAGNLLVMEHLEKVMVYDPVVPDGAENFLSNIQDRLAEIFDSKELLAKVKIDYEAVATAELKKAVEEADIIVTVTPSRKPIIKQEWVKPGTHFNCIGADMEGKEELEKEIFKGARIVVDDRIQATSIGETEIPFKSGIITMKDIACEIGDIITGASKGRLADEDITIFDTTGLALQDLISAVYVLKKAEDTGMQTYSL